MGNCFKRPQQQIIDANTNTTNSNTNNNADLIYSFNGEECIVCMDNPVQAAILDCGHLKFCIRCLYSMAMNTDRAKSYLNFCPICRNPFKGYITFSPRFYYKIN